MWLTLSRIPSQISDHSRINQSAYDHTNMICVRDVRQTEPIARPDSGSSAKGFIKQFVVRQTGMLRAVQVRGREAGVGQIRADEGVVPGSRQIRVRGADVGRSRADKGVVPRSRQSRSQGQTWVGARQAKTEMGIQDRRRGYWDTDKGRTDVDVGLSQRL